MDQNPDGAKELRRQNRAYVFFREVQLSDKDEAVGAQGVPLTAGRPIAVDKALHVYGTPFFIAGELPIESEQSKTPFHRLMIAQDTGSAIAGPARADLYFGAGADAGKVSGRLKHNMQFVMLVPKGIDPVARGRKLPVPDERPSAKIAKEFPQTEALKDKPAEKPADVPVGTVARGTAKDVAKDGAKESFKESAKAPAKSTANTAAKGPADGKEAAPAPTPAPAATTLSRRPRLWQNRCRYRPPGPTFRNCPRSDAIDATVTISDETSCADPRSLRPVAAQACAERGGARALGERRQARRSRCASDPRRRKRKRRPLIRRRMPSRPSPFRSRWQRR